MIQDYVTALHLPISRVRLEAYRSRPNGDDFDMVANYFWNVALSEALYPALQALEVTLRNSIHAALTAKYGTEEWYDYHVPLQNRQRELVNDAKRSIIERKGEGGITPGRVIAELNFGFWTALLRRPYFTTLWEPNNYLLLKAVFPEAPRYARNRKVIYKRHDEIRQLRNRVFHFEPIWNRPDLPGDHRQIIEAIGWISPTLRDTVAFCDRFPYVYERGRRDLEDKIRTYLAS